MGISTLARELQSSSMGLLSSWLSSPSSCSEEPMRLLSRFPRGRHRPVIVILRSSAALEACLSREPTAQLTTLRWLPQTTTRPAVSANAQTVLL